MVSYICKIFSLEEHLPTDDLFEMKTFKIKVVQVSFVLEQRMLESRIIPINLSFRFQQSSIQ